MKSSKLYFFLLVLFSFLLSYLSKELLNTDELVINSLLGKFTSEQLKDVLNYKDRWEWLGYLIIPFIILVKVSVIALAIDIFLSFFDNLDGIKYKKLFNIVVKAEFVFLLVIVFKTIWFYVFQHDYTLEDLQYFYPLSAINITGYDGLQPWFVYPFQVLNLFELAYWFILAYLLGKELSITTDKGLTIVASSYGVGLLIWVVAIMFFTLNMS